MDLLRAQAKGQEFDEAKAQDKIEAQLEREMWTVAAGIAVGVRPTLDSQCVGLDR
ncbi:hypothetical protein Esi_0381_0004 [Ectocarpus siliculosus]|uniref:Uncharacterized protein n=1 Tax=Ectocarpus siliculosus TaxID=2880 RepID=D7FZP9_ECTSI|nr:hypothetical protein Esi_0381_0004 [Ectocarpus siliculosus]|eukprot:CBJ32856.1 hypothetical protein Esi_0381_0004 [Ectocarpus siliculosus]